MRKLVFALWALLLFPIYSTAPTEAASTQTLANVVSTCGTPNSTYSANQNRPDTIDTNGNHCVAASVTASVTGFTPNDSVANLAVTPAATSVNVALPSGTTVKVTNTGTKNVHIKLSVGASTAASTDDVLIAGAAAGITVGSNTYINAITDGSDTTTLSIAGGAGLVTGFGGGGGGSGGTVAISQSGTDNNVKSVTGSTTAVTQATGTNLHAVLDTTSTTAVTQATGTNLHAVLDTTSTTAVTQATGTNLHAVIDSGVVGNTQGSTTSGQSGPLVQGAVTTAAPSYTTAQTSPLSLDTAGNLRVNVVTGGTSSSVAQGSTTSGQSVVPMGCRTLTSAPTDTTAQTNMPSCDTAGALRVNVSSATGVAQGSTTSGQTVSPIGCRTLSSNPTDTTAQTNMPVCHVNGSLAVTGAGAAGTADAGVVTVQGIASGTAMAVAGNLTAGTSNSGIGYHAMGASAATGCSSQAFTNAQINPVTQDLLGNVCVKISPQVTNTVSGGGSQTSTTSTQVVALVSSKSLYITAFSCTNSGATAGTISFQDGSGGATLWVTSAPAGGGSNLGSVTPLFHTTSGNGLYFAPSAGSTTNYCYASGFSQ